MVQPAVSFGALLQEKLLEWDQALANEAALRHDPVERLRLEAALLATGGRCWSAGAPMRYTDTPAKDLPVAPSFDIRYPASAAGGGLTIR